MKKKICLLFAVTTALMFLTLPTNASEKSTTTEPLEATVDEVLAGTSLERVDDYSADSDVPWRVERDASGTITIVFGGINNVPFKSDTILYAVNNPAGTEAVAAASWSCNMHHNEIRVVREVGWLRGVRWVTCSGVSSHAIDWKFYRSSWSGYRSYVPFNTGGFRTLANQAYFAYIDCGSGGTYDYKLRYWSRVRVGGEEYQGPYAENKKVRTNCGTRPDF